MFQEPLDRDEPWLSRIGFRRRSQELGELSRSSLANLRDSCEQFGVRLRKVADRITSAERKSGPVDKPSLGKLVIRGLDK